MKTRLNNKLLICTALSGLAGVVIGVLVAKMSLAAAPAPGVLQVLEREHIRQRIEAVERVDQAVMQGACEDGTIKALPSATIAACVDGKWVQPTQLGLKGSDGAIRVVPEEPCLPLAGTPPGILDMCRYSSNGKVIGRSAQSSANR